MENVIARNELAVEFNAEIEPQLQALALKPGVLTDPGRRPAASTVYTKGAWFLQFLEQRYRPRDVRCRS